VDEGRKKGGRRLICFSREGEARFFSTSTPGKEKDYGSLSSARKKKKKKKGREKERDRALKRNGLDDISCHLLRWGKSLILSFPHLHKGTNPAREED